MQQTNYTLHFTSPRRAYYQLLLLDSQLTHQQDLSLILKLVELADTHGYLSLTTTKRKLICTELDIQPANLSKYIKRLKDANLLKGGAGEFTLPHYLPLDQSIILTLTKK